MALDYIRDDGKPIQLRAEDQADAQSLLIDLGALLREIQEDAETVRGIATRETANRRLTGRAVDLFENSGRSIDVHDRLTRALRAAGSL